MKANRKDRRGDERAVSAVIGVILMVAITVTIAATVYIYMNGMIGGQTQTPNIALLADNTNNQALVTSADPGVPWTDITITGISSGGYNLISNTDFVINSGTTDVRAGDTISTNSYLSGHAGESVTLQVTYKPTNTLIGTVTIS